MTSIPAYKLRPAHLRFDPALTARVATHAFKGLRTHGPFDSSALDLGDGALLFVFPKQLRAQAHGLAEALLRGVPPYPGFAKMFGVAVSMGQALGQLQITGDVSNLAVAARHYRDQIAAWNADPRERDPALALVLVPHSERVDTDTPYYEAKAAFASLGIPTQMVTTELIEDRDQFQWSVANIALAAFAKLGGIPWAVDAPAGEDDLILGIGRAEVGPEGERRRVFGYAVSFVSNGIYRQTWSFTPTADESVYEQRLEATVRQALSADLDRPPARLVVHLAKSAGWREIDAVERALTALDLTLPVAFLRLDDTSPHDVADTDQQTFAPPKGLVAKLGPRRALLQTEELGPIGPPDGPLLVAMDRRSTVSTDDFDDLVAQVFRLAHANWRGFNARSKPATLVYGEQLASLVGHLEDVEAWKPDLLRSELRDRPWFL